MIKDHKKANLPSKYNAGERVFVRQQRRGGKQSEGEVKKRNLKNHSYKVSYTSPLSGRIEHKWITVIDITSLTYGKELEKQKIAASRRKHKKIEVFDPD